MGLHVAPPAQTAMRLSAEQEQQMVGARRQLLAGLRRSRIQRQRLVSQLRVADGDSLFEELTPEALTVVRAVLLLQQLPQLQRAVAAPQVCSDP